MLDYVKQRDGDLGDVADALLCRRRRERKCDQVGQSTVICAVWQDPLFGFGIKATSPEFYFGLEVSLGVVDGDFYVLHFGVLVGSYPAIRESWFSFFLRGNHEGEAQRSDSVISEEALTWLSTLTAAVGSGGCFRPNPAG